MRKALICVLALAAVGGAYYLGTASNTTPPTKPDATESAKGPIIEDGLIVPTGLKIPDNAPPIPKIDKPTEVLAGEVKAPKDLLRTEPPPLHPALLIPSIPTDKK